MGAAHCGNQYTAAKVIFKQKNRIPKAGARSRQNRGVEIFLWRHRHGTDPYKGGRDTSVRQLISSSHAHDHRLRNCGWLFAMKKLRKFLRRTDLGVLKPARRLLTRRSGSMLDLYHHTGRQDGGAGNYFYNRATRKPNALHRNRNIRRQRLLIKCERYYGTSCGWP